MRLLSPTDPRAAGETSPELVQSRSQWIRPTLAPSGRQASGTAVSTASGGGVCGQVSPASHCRNLDAAGVSPLEVYTRERRWHCRAATGRRRHEPEATTLKGQSRIRRRPFNRIRELQKRFFECTTMPVWAGVPPLVAATSTDTRTIRAIRGALEMAENCCSIPLTLARVVLSALPGGPIVAAVTARTYLPIGYVIDRPKNMALG